MADDHIRPERPSRRREEIEEERPRRRVRRSEDDDDDGGGVNTIIPYKNPKALVGYYLSVFSLIPGVGLLLGPAAIVLGVLGIKHRNHKRSAGGLGHAITALVLGGLTSLANWGLVVFFGVALMMK